MDAETFWSKVEKTESCWLWRGNIDNKGYGRTAIHLNGERVQLAHRAAFILTNGPITEVPGNGPHGGKALDHLCRNRSCVRPDHLDPCGQRENMRRTQAYWGGRGSVVDGVVACKRGHELTPENILERGRLRKCKACHKIMEAAWVDRNRVRLRAYQVVKQREYRAKRKADNLKQHSS